MSHISAEHSGSHLDHLMPMLPRHDPRPFYPLLLSFVVALSSGCSEPPPAPRARSISAIIAEKWPIFRPAQPNQSDDRRRFKDAPVYIDGKRASVIRPLEVPSSIKPRMRTRPGATPAPRYSVAEYIAAVGADLPKVREVHLYGGRGRVSVISGAEVRKHKEDLLVLFTAGTRGKPRIGWPPNGIESTGAIDLVQAIVVYQDREPPVYEPKKGILFFADKKPIDGIPYAPAEEVKGTRFYADGVLLGWMKRKTLPNSILAPGADQASGLFSLAAFVASLGVELRQVKAIELIQDDDAVARLAGALLSADPPLLFTLPRRNQGNLLLLMPSSAFAGAPASPATVPIRISAVQLFLKQAPPTRKYAALADLTAPAEAPGRKGPGSEEPQGSD